MKTYRLRVLLVLLVLLPILAHARNAGFTPNSSLNLNVPGSLLQTVFGTMTVGVTVTGTAYPDMDNISEGEVDISLKNSSGSSLIYGSMLIQSGGTGNTDIELPSVPGIYIMTATCYTYDQITGITALVSSTPYNIKVCQITFDTDPVELNIGGTAVVTMTITPTLTNEEEEEISIQNPSPNLLTSTLSLSWNSN